MSIKKSIFTLTLFSTLLNTNILLASECSNLIKYKIYYDSSSYEDDNKNIMSKVVESLEKISCLPDHFFDDIQLQGKKYINENKGAISELKNIISENQSDKKLIYEICLAINNEILTQFSLSKMFNVFLFNILPCEYKVNFIKYMNENYQFKDWNEDKKIKFKKEKSETISLYIVNELFTNGYFDGSSFDSLPNKYKQKFILDTFNYAFPKGEYEDDCRKNLLVDLILNNQSKFTVPIYNILKSLDLEKLKHDIALNVRKILCSIEKEGTIKKEDVNLFKIILQLLNK